MKLFLVLVLVALSLAEAARIRRQDKFSTKYDDFNIDEVLASDRLVDNEFNCIMGRGKCTPEGALVRDNVKEAIDTECEECNPKQKSNADKLLIFLYKNKPDKFKEFQEKYDPNKLHYNRHKDVFEGNATTFFP